MAEVCVTMTTMPIKTNLAMKDVTIELILFTVLFKKQCCCKFQRRSNLTIWGDRDSNRYYTLELIINVQPFRDLPQVKQQDKPTNLNYRQPIIYDFEEMESRHRTIMVLYNSFYSRSRPSADKSFRTTIHRS